MVSRDGFNVSYQLSYSYPTSLTSEACICFNLNPAFRDVAVRTERFTLERDKMPHSHYSFYLLHFPCLCHQRDYQHINQSFIDRCTIEYQSVCHLSQPRSQAQQPRLQNPDLPLHRHLLQLICGNAEAFPAQLRDITSPACCGSPLEPLPSPHFYGRIYSLFSHYMVIKIFLW